MTTCARCGRPSRPVKLGPGEHHDDSICYASDAFMTDSALLVVQCRDAELSNLRSLLRSVTGNLERAADLLAHDTGITIVHVRAAAREVDLVLEVLS